MEANQKIVLLGATGYTGRLIAQLLREREITFDIAGRNESRLKALQLELKLDTSIIISDLSDKASISILLDKADVLINCVGPYNLYGRQLIEQVALRPIIYLDLTGEQDFVKDSMDTLDLIAKEHQSLLVHSCAFESSLVDFMAAGLLDEKQKYSYIHSYYYFNKSRPSPGTRLTMQLARHYPTYYFREEEYILLKPFEKSFSVKHKELAIDAAAFMPYPEVLFFAHKYQTKEVGSYLLSNESEIKYVHIAEQKSKEAITNRHQNRVWKGPSVEERERQEFRIVICAEQEDGELKKAELLGKNMYQVTAEIIVLMIQAIQNKQQKLTGFQVPSAIGNSKEILSRLIALCDLKLELESSLTIATDEV